MFFPADPITGDIFYFILYPNYNLKMKEMKK